MRAWDDKRLETIISAVLRIGVLLSAAVVLLGAACFLMGNGHQPADYHVFRGVPESYRSVAAVIQALGMSDCRALIQLGLLLLIATPIVRVASSLVGFGLERDRTYVLLTAVVLSILIYSLAMAR